MNGNGGEARYEGGRNGEGLPHGRGVMTRPDGSRYVGEFRDGQAHGQGAETDPDGARYEGEYHGGKRHGRGMETWPDGASRTGEYEAGEVVRGVYTWPDGSQFDGTYRDGQPARGVLTTKDGTVSEGEFGPAAGGEGFGLQGRGSILRTDGTRFDCNRYRDGAAEGQGSAVYPDGSHYEGAFVAGKPHGQGVKTWPADGISYSGAFVEGKAEGLVIRIDSGGWTGLPGNPAAVRSPLAPQQDRPRSRAGFAR